jgi:hypothetical protein
MNSQVESIATPAGPQAIPFYVEDLMTAARAETELSDFGDLGFTTGLDVLCKSLRTEANLHEGGVIGQGQELLRLLINRLRYINDVKKHPEILQEKIIAPIVVVGLPRTGTSKLQRVMSGDPGVQRLDVWRLLNPAPFPDEEAGKPEGRIAFAKVVEDTFRTQFPGWMARHPMEAEEPDEELFIMEMSFESTVSAMLARAPTFFEYSMNCDPRPTYKILFEMMQYLQWQDGGSKGRPWIMKSPVHIGYMDILFEFFPDATVVHCHRDPLKTVPSFATTIQELRKTSTDQIDPVEVGHEWFDYWARLTDRYLAVRDKLPLDQIVDAKFEEICDDPLAVIKRIYQKAGRELTPEAIAGCTEYDSRRPANHWGEYSYTLEEYGLDAKEIRTRFAEYLKLFP